MDVKINLTTTTRKRVSVELSSDQVTEILSRHFKFPTTASIYVGREYDSDFITLSYEEVETTDSLG